MNVMHELSVSHPITQRDCGFDVKKRREVLSGL